MRRAYSVHKRVDAVARLLPELFTERVITPFAVPIVQLVAPPMPWLPADLPRSADHLLDELLGDLLAIARHVRDFGAVGAQGIAFFFAECVGEDEVCSVSKRGTHESKGDACRSGSVFDDCASGRKPPVSSGALDHRSGHAILHAAGRVRRLQFNDHPGRAGWYHMAKFDQRSVADRIKNLQG